MDISPQRRPTMVWLITIFYFVSTGWGLLSLLLAYAGAARLPPAQANYLAQQNDFDILMIVFIGAANLIAVVSLFRLRRAALYLFVAALALGILMTVYQIIAKGWLDTLGPSAIVGTAIGWVTSIVMISYCYWLRKKGVLG